MASIDPTFVGQVASVSGGIVRVRLRHDLPTTLVLVEGESYRVGQIGGFFRIPVGYTQLYAVCTQVGADAVPPTSSEDYSRIEQDPAINDGLHGFRWMTVVLFGESVSDRFERGVGQYPTVGDEVHFVTSHDLSVVYGQVDNKVGLTIGSIASSGGIPAALNLDKLVTRHSSIVGSTGSGKSNLVSVVLDGLSNPDYPSARILVIDPHGEYTKIAPARSKTFRLSPSEHESQLVVPYWALPFDELITVTFGAMSTTNEAIVRDMVEDMKREAAAHLKIETDKSNVTADSPIPFSIRRLWFELDDYERATFRMEDKERVRARIVSHGDPEKLISNEYEAYQPGAKEPFKNPSPRGIGRQLEFARSRLRDPRYEFLFSPSGGYNPDVTGKVVSDLDALVASWVGHDRPLTVLDVSELPSDVAPDVVGLLVRVVYDALLWAGDSPVSGRAQPLLIVVDEAHRFVPEGGSSSCHRTLMQVAKEGRKFGVGLMVVTQRPSEIDSAILSQCGTMIALRTTNGNDRRTVAAAFPDDLGALADLLPSLRTGEGLFVGEAMFVPSRVRIRLGDGSDSSGDPKVSARWQGAQRPEAGAYSKAIQRWRHQSLE
ncbi:MAG: ATP-binding protein [Hyphomicrobiales bacterium]|nr:MAG: ATP-binding protein [Hyphomicrobiales bacterium]